MNRGLAVTLALLVAAWTPLSAQRASRTPSPPRSTPPRSTAAAPPPEARVPFKAGETLSYDVSWSTFLTAGTVVTTVKEKRPSYGSVAYYVVAEARPTPLLSKLYSLYYKIDTLIDTYTLLPQRASTYSEERGRHRFRTTMFDRGVRKARFEYQSDTTVKSEFPVSPYVQDALSALYVLRAIPMKAGDRMTMPLSDSGSTFKLQLEVAAPERVKVPLGVVNAWKVTPTVYDDRNRAVGRNIAIWLSDDPRRLPVKIQGGLAVGSFVLALREAH